MTVCLPFSKIRFLTVNPRTGYILLGFIINIIIYCYYAFCYLNDIGTYQFDSLRTMSQIDTSPLTHLGKNSDILFIKKIGYSFLML